MQKREKKTPELTNLEQLLDLIGSAAANRDRVNVALMMETIGTRSFGPLLLVAGIILITPLSAIPGIPTTMGFFVLLIAVQLLLRKRRCWIPKWLQKRYLRRDKLDVLIKWLRRPARFIDRLLRPRLTYLIHGAGLYAIAIICLAVAAVLPAMELVPLSAHGAGVALTAFGLALIAHDGFVALLAFTITAASFGLIIFNLLF